MKEKVKNLTYSLLLPIAAGAIGSLFTMPTIDGWYATLNKPIFNPPNWMFGPVWTLLYFMMGISLYLVTQTKTKGKESKAAKKTGYIVFGSQLILNALWSIIFFGSKELGLALFTLILLWIFIAASIYYFYKVNKTAAYLLVPYILWGTFAGILNASILALN